MGRLRVSNSATLQDPNFADALKDGRTAFRVPRFPRSRWGHMEETVARLSGSGVAAAMVELIINCANAAAPAGMPTMPAVSLPYEGSSQPKGGRGGVQSRLLRAARRLQETVGVCFQVRVGDDAAEEVCQSLSAYDTNTVQTVLSSELLEAGINPEDVSVVGYDATPNPRSYNPLLDDETSFFAPPSGFALGRL
ncbi:Uncharacterized protein SCF082_LOCUS7418 [Durusdinium trenchii]|uniref:Uncharacterized protein n=1 Tax=Durusdinium trenchii TaxID=1381693 RepID=A0ABP0IJ31_9DINO